MHDLSLKGTTLDQLVDPQIGIIFGYGWATDIDDFLGDQPRAVVTRDEGDVQVWTLPGDITLCDLPVAVTFVFRLDALIGIDMLFDVEQFDAADVEGVIDLIRQWFSEELTSPDDGVLEVEEVTTKLVLDLMDKQLSLQDIDA